MTLLRIGDLARLGGVSVRMLRHYHEIKLLVPERIDGQTGYRLYDTDQLAELRTIVMLKNLGVPLAQIGGLVGASGSSAAMRAVLIERRQALCDEIASHQVALTELDQQLALLNGDVPMSTQPSAQEIEVDVKPVAARLVAQLTAVAESWAPEHIGPTIQPLYPELISRMAAAGVAIAGPSTAWYEDTDDGRILVHATLTIAEAPKVDPATLDFEIVELPALERVASTIHIGSMDNCDTTYGALLEWIDLNGHRSVGHSREIDIECEPGKDWIVELQVELTAD